MTSSHFELDAPKKNRQTVSIPTRFLVLRGKNKKINAFNRRTPRFEGIKSVVPGPGSYSPDGSKSTIIRESSSYSEKGYGQMCSSDPRFSELQRISFNRPGPGHYSLPTFLHETSSKNKNRIYGTSGFVPTGSRIVTGINFSKVPGPGKYSSNLPTTQGISSVFRSKTIRPFLKEKKQQARKKSNPSFIGKGSGKNERYQRWESSNVRGLQKRELSSLIKRMKRKKKGIFYNDQKLAQSVFRSKSNRSGCLKKDNFPGPGNYEKKSRKGIENIMTENQMFVKPSACFASSGKLDRFGKSYLSKMRKKRGIPGPGQYHPNHHEEEIRRTGGEKFGGNSSMFASNSKRFRRNCTGSKKGPGDYELVNDGRREFHLNYQIGINLEQSVFVVKYYMKDPKNVLYRKYYLEEEIERLEKISEETNSSFSISTQLINSMTEKCDIVKEIDFKHIETLLEKILWNRINNSVTSDELNFSKDSTDVSEEYTSKLPNIYTDEEKAKLRGDFNKLDIDELEGIKNLMEADFLLKNVTKEDKEFEYEKNVQFATPSEDSGWD